VARAGTPLVAASLNGEVECVKILLENQANVNTSTQNLNSPLMKAALNGHNLVRPPPCVRLPTFCGRAVVSSCHWLYASLFLCLYAIQEKHSSFECDTQ